MICSVIDEQMPDQAIRGEAMLPFRDIALVINTMQSSLDDMLHWAHEGISRPTIADQMLSIIARVVQRQQRVLGDLQTGLGLATDNPRLQPLELGELVEQAFENATRLVKERLSALQWLPPVPSLWVAADRERLTLALLRLFDYLLCLADPMTVVTVDAVPQAGQAVITVTLNPGQGGESVPAVLADPLRQPLPPERGMALALLRVVLAQHGGRLDAEYQWNAGEGYLIITVRLPRCEAVQASGSYR